MENKALNLAKKLYELHKQGIGGERENATNMLERLMQNSGITWDMLEENHRSEHVLEIPKEQKDLLMQIVANVAGHKTKFWSYKYAPKGHFKYGLEVTPSEFIEIKAKLDFFYHKYIEEKDLFYQAFIQKNRLYAKPEPNKESEDKELTLEERQRLFKIRNMMEGLDKHDFIKRIDK